MYVQVMLMLISRDDYSYNRICRIVSLLVSIILLIIFIFRIRILNRLNTRNCISFPLTSRIFPARFLDLAFLFVNLKILQFVD